MKMIFGFFLSCWVSAAAVLSWEPDGIDIVSYRAYYVNLTNQDNWVMFAVVFHPATSVAIPKISAGTTCRFYVEAVNQEGLTSIPSEIATYRRPFPLPTIHLTAGSVGEKAGNKWNDVKIFFQPISLTFYDATNYLVTATPATGSPVTVAATNSPAVFPALRVDNYTVTIRSQNSDGSSPGGSSLLMDARNPKKPKVTVVEK